MRVIVVDGQGGGIGKAVVTQLRRVLPELTILALGSNSIATAAMMKAGASAGATGEHAVVYNCTWAERNDVIVGAQGICLAGGMLGEISAEMSAAVAESRAKKLLVPTSACGVCVLGVREAPLGEYLAELTERLRAEVENQSEI